MAKRNNLSSSWNDDAILRFKSAQNCLWTVIGLKLYSAVADVRFWMIVAFHQNVPRDPVWEGDTL